MKNFIADIYTDGILSVTPELLCARGVRGLILDIDNTLTAHNNPIPSDAVLHHLRTLENAGIRLCVVSNNSKDRVEAFCKKIGVELFVHDALKPKKYGYEKATECMRLKKNETAAVGDQVFTDVWGAKRAGCVAILTKPIHKGGEGAFIALKRLLEKPFVRGKF